MAIMKLSVKKVQEQWEVFSRTLEADESVVPEGDSLYDVWGGEVTLLEVNRRLASNTLEATPWSIAEGNKSMQYDHAARIAYLCVHPDEKPIEVDLGIPALGFHHFSVDDGNHRLAAAIVLGAPTILANVSGQLSASKSLRVR